MTSSKANVSNVVVVDGSNIATEGRSSPSLRQLDEAVRAYRDEFPDAVVTVVVDATFGHRIDKKESSEFDAGIANNELVAPPAGAIGRGDAFVLSIANKVGARVLSNDSFQEFHGDYPWLFDEGRLIGGKPVPHIGWVFVERLPVKGPVSRKAQRAARRTDRAPGAPFGEQGGQPADARADGTAARRSARRQDGHRGRDRDQPTGRAVGATGVGSDRQRRAAVPRLRRAPPPREQRERSRRVLLVARRLCDRR